MKRQYGAEMRPGTEIPGGALTPVDSACRLIWNSVPRVRGVESVALLAAQGRILAEDLHAQTNVPPFANSAMDGYAVRAEDVRRAPASLPVSRRIAAGQAGGALPAGEAARIFTGAALPDGADAVAIQENCRAGDGCVTVLTSLASGENVRAAGDAVRAGDLLFRAGHRLLPQDIGVLASTGRAELAVRRKLRVALLATGTELVMPGKPLRPGQIYNGNFHALASLLQNMPVALADLGIADDDLGATRRILLDASARADCIITTGGVSVGEEDHLRDAVESEGELELWKLAIKPGKPLAYGKVRQTAFFGLPGNPVSAFVTFCLIVRPALFRMMGAAASTPAGYRLPAGFSRPPSGDRQEYLRAAVEVDAEGKEKVRPCDNQSSGAGSSLSRSTGLYVVPPRTAVAPGDRLSFIPYSELLA